MRPMNEYFLTTRISDVSTAGSVYVPVPDSGEIVEAYSVLHGAITVANATLTIKPAGTAATNGTITIAFSGSAAGDVDSCTPSAANSVTEGSYVEVATDGGSTTAAAADIVLVVSRSYK